MGLLLMSVLVGGIAGAVRAKLKGRTWNIPTLRLTWLVTLAVLPQVLIVYSARGTTLPDSIVAAVLVASQSALLLFAWINRAQPGFRALGLGLALNLLVISLNGGLMPISPTTVEHLWPDAPADAWQVGQRLGASKDIVLSDSDTRLAWLADRFTLPAWLGYRVAFSLGDVVIAGGVFWALWSLGRPTPSKEQSCTPPNSPSTPETLSRPLAMR